MHVAAPPRPGVPAPGDDLHPQRAVLGASAPSRSPSPSSTAHGQRARRDAAVPGDDVPPGAPSPRRSAPRVSTQIPRPARRAPPSTSARRPSLPRSPCCPSARRRGPDRARARRRRRPRSSAAPSPAPRSPPRSTEPARSREGGNKLLNVCFSVAFRWTGPAHRRPRRRRRRGPPRRLGAASPGLFALMAVPARRVAQPARRARRDGDPRGARALREGRALTSHARPTREGVLAARAPRPGLPRVRLCRSRSSSVKRVARREPDAAYGLLLDHLGLARVLWSVVLARARTSSRRSHALARRGRWAPPTC